MRSARRRGIALCALLCVILGFFRISVAGAQPAEVGLKKGVGEFQDLEFAAAIGTLEELLKRTDVADSQRLVALELIAISHLSLGNTAESRRAFVRLLKISPDYALRNHDGSPKVESLFESVRAGMPKRPPDTSDPGQEDGPVPTELAMERLSDPRAGGRLEIVVRSKGDEPKELRLFWRTDEAGSFQTTPLRKTKSGWRARLSLPASKTGYALQYYVEALGVVGQELARLGSPAEPLVLTVRGEKATGGGAKGSAWYGRWPVWVGVGAVVVGGSILVLSSGSDEQQGALSPGRITLSP